MNQRSEKPSPLVKVPTLIGWNQAAGNIRPISLPWPVREDTGTSRPEKFTVGIMAMTVVAKTAATWVLVNVETTCPKLHVEKRRAKLLSRGLRTIP